MDDVTVQHGLAEQHRPAGAALYETAFGPKMERAIPSQELRREVIEASLDGGYAITATAGDRLIGLAGFHTAEGSLTGALTFSGLRARLGSWGGIRAAVILSLLERTPQPGELLMDGIAVDPAARGQGVGTLLLDEVAAHARRLGCTTVRLDVIDSNPRARALYERRGFVAVKTERFRWLRPIIGFEGSTTMELTVA